MRPSWRIRFASLTLLIVSSLGAVAQAQPELSREQKLKAAYLFNFTKYMQWPSTAFTAATAPLRICVADNEIFRQFLADLARGRKVGKSKRPVEVATTSNSSECHLLYAETRISLGPTTNTILIADHGKAAKGQAAVTFFIDDSKVRFYLSQSHFEALNIKVSSELLKLSRSWSE